MFLLKNKLQLFLTTLFVCYFLWWASFQSIVSEQGTSVQWFGGTYGSIALIGAFIGFVTAQKWGGFKTVLGKALMFFSLGLLAQEAGQLILTYYAYGLKVEQIPYPSPGDVAYFGSVILYLIAAFFLAKAVAVKFSLKKTEYKAVAIAIPVVILAVSYAVLLRGYSFDTSQPLTVFLDVGYPIGQASYISVAVVAYLLSRKMLGGVLRSGILLVFFALVLQYISDFLFIYQTHREQYIPGKFVDLFYLASYFFMATALARFLSIYSGLKNKGGSQAQDVAPQVEEKSNG